MVGSGRRVKTSQERPAIYAHIKRKASRAKIPLFFHQGLAGMGRASASASLLPPRRQLPLLFAVRTLLGRAGRRSRHVASPGGSQLVRLHQRLILGQLSELPIDLLPMVPQVATRTSTRWDSTIRTRSVWSAARSKMRRSCRAGSQALATSQDQLTRRVSVASKPADWASARLRRSRGAPRRAGGPASWPRRRIRRSTPPPADPQPAIEPLGAVRRGP